MRLVAIFPLDVHAGARGQVHFHRFRVSGGHNLKYRTEKQVSRLSVSPVPLEMTNDRRTQLVTVVTSRGMVSTQKPPASVIIT